jgi:hypothetical protein
MADKDKPPTTTAQGAETEAFIARLRQSGAVANRPESATTPATPVTTASVASFVEKLKTMPKAGTDRGRLIFAMDATASREPTWDLAQRIQARMFEETAALGGLSVQLAWYRGMAEFAATPWVQAAKDLVRRMADVTCRGGQTQIEAVLRHAIHETKARRVNALVFVGDCMEEDLDRLCQCAGALGLLGVPVFLFQEGHDEVAGRAFAEIARLTGGAHCHFDGTSPDALRDLIGAVAVYAAGGRPALEKLAGRQGGVILQLTRQMR